MNLYTNRQLRHYLGYRGSLIGTEIPAIGYVRNSPVAEEQHIIEWMRKDNNWQRLTKDRVLPPFSDPFEQMARGWIPVEEFLKELESSGRGASIQTVYRKAWKGELASSRRGKRRWLRRLGLDELVNKPND